MKLGKGAVFGQGEWLVVVVVVVALVAEHCAAWRASRRAVWREGEGCSGGGAHRIIAAGGILLAGPPHLEVVFHHDRVDH